MLPRVHVDCPLVRLLSSVTTRGRADIDGALPNIRLQSSWFRRPQLYFATAESAILDTLVAVGAEKIRPDTPLCPIVRGSQVAGARLGLFRSCSPIKRPTAIELYEGRGPLVLCRHSLRYCRCIR